MRTPLIFCVIIFCGCERLYDGDSTGAQVEVVAAPGDVILVSDEPPGAHCVAGGKKIELGKDLNGNGVLDADEVTQTTYLCNGLDGQDGESIAGSQALIEISDATPEQCPNGGKVMSAGLDVNANGALDPEEVTTIQAVCNGVDGEHGSDGQDAMTVLFDISNATAGQCLNGGKVIQMGLDLDGDGVLDPEEVSVTEVICNGLDGDSGPGGSGTGGVNDGTASNPVTLVVEDLVDGAWPYHTTIAASGHSFYTFTTFHDPAQPGEYNNVPHSIDLLGVNSDIDVRLYANADFVGSPMDVSCRYVAADKKYCTTGPLQENTAYYVRLVEQNDVANAFFLNVSFGANQGSALQPIALQQAGELDGTTYRYAGSVQGHGRTYYSVTPANSDIFTLRFTETKSLPTASGSIVTWSYSPVNDGDEPLGPCTPPTIDGDVLCPTAWLEAGQTYVFEVRELWGAGAAFAVALEEGDTITPMLPAETWIDGTFDAGDGVFQLVPQQDGTYTVSMGLDDTRTWYRYDDLWKAKADTPRLQSCWSGSCAAYQLEQGRTTYIRLSSQGPYELIAQAGGGDDGSIEEPVALQLDEPYASSADSSNFGNSYYSFHTGDNPRQSYTVSLLNAFGGPGWNLYASPTFSSSLMGCSSPGTATSTVCPTPNLEPNTTYYIRVNAYYAGFFDILVQPGDLVTPSLPLDEPFVVEPGTDEWYQITVSAAPSILQPYTPETSVVVNLAHRPVTTSSQQISNCTTHNSCSIDPACASCSQFNALAPGTYYVRVRNTTSEAATLTVELHEPTPVVLQPGTWLEDEPLLPDSHLVYALTPTASGSHNLTTNVSNPDGGCSYRRAVRNAQTNANATSGAGTICDTSFNFTANAGDLYYFYMESRLADDTQYVDLLWSEP